MLEAVFFYLFAACSIASALGVIFSRSAIYSVLCLVATMCFLAGIFVLLKAYFVATVLVLVYAGAILVLFLFVVMLLDFKTARFDWKGLGWSPVAALAAGGALFAETLWAARSFPDPGPSAMQGTAQEIGRALFFRYVLPFELTSFLLLAAVVGVVVLAKKEARP
jgi:NADH-quinone oxidoreductase subunit J